MKVVQWLTHALVGCAVAMMTTGTAASAASSDADPPHGSIVDPNAERPGPGTVTVPFWTGTFTYGGGTYSYDMVGTSPAAGAATTTIAADIIPLVFRFADGTVLDGTGDAVAAANSPLFQRANFQSGMTQYGDAIQRAEFAGILRGADYHVLLVPTVLPAVTVVVPSDKGTSYHTSTGVTAAEVDGPWLLDRLHEIVNGSHVDATAVPIILSHLVTGYRFAGIHGTVANSVQKPGNQPVETYIFAAWVPAGSTAHAEDLDASTLSHEVLEWMNDPFGLNTAPRWTSPLATEYGCDSKLEVGDPLVYNVFLSNSYHLQDVAYLSWFARQQPSIALGGKYDYQGVFKAPAPSC